MPAAVVSLGRSCLRLTLLGILLAYALGFTCYVSNDTPEFYQPRPNAVVETDAAYVAVRTVTGQDFQVVLEPEGQAPQDVTSSFTLKRETSSGHSVFHARLPVPVGEHRLSAVQTIASSGETYTANHVFSRVPGATSTLGGLGDAGATIVRQGLEGTVASFAGQTVLLFGETELSDASVLASTLATSGDVDASDGIDLVYFDEPTAISSVLDLAAATPPENEEDEIQLTAGFERSGDLFAFYQRIDRDALEPLQGIGLAVATGGVLPFTALEFPAAQPAGGGHFDDDYSLFQAGDFAQVRGVVPDGPHLLLFGVNQVGPPEQSKVVLARVPLASVEDPTTYEYWTEIGGVRDWRTSPNGSLVLWKNSSAPSVHWNAHLGRWLAVHSVAWGKPPGYSLNEPHSSIALRVADDPRGPWSEPILVYGMPQSLVGGSGSAVDPMQLPDFDAGSLVYLAATDAGNVAQPALPFLVEVDLDQAGIPAAALPPVLVPPSGPTTSNPGSVSGYASPNDSVTIYVEGVAQGTVTASSVDGSFTISAVLDDGPNTLSATANSGGAESGFSNSVTLEYQDSVDRDQDPPDAISGTVVWTSGNGDPYVVGGTLTVPAGATFVLQPGTNLEFTAGSTLLVEGELLVQGADGNLVSFRPQVASPCRGAWTGLDVNGGNALIDYALIECVDRGVYARGGADITVTNSVIREFDDDGIHVATSAADILYNLIDNEAGAETDEGIYINGFASVLVQENEIRGAKTGIWVKFNSANIYGNYIHHNDRGVFVDEWSSPKIQNWNLITQNDDGVHIGRLWRYPVGPAGNPRVRSNSIYGNTDWNLFIADDPPNNEAIIDATNNWWGTTDPIAIAASIRDRAETNPVNESVPVADWVPFRDAEQGNSIGVGEVLAGAIESDLTLSPGNPYIVVDRVFLRNAATLTLEAGSVLDFGPGARLTTNADATVLAQGTLGNEILFTSSAATPARGDYYGFDIKSGQTTTNVFDHVVFEYADLGILAQSVVQVTNSTFREFDTSGLWLSNGGPHLVSDNTVDNTAGPRQGDGISVTGLGTSGLVADNTVVGASVGIRLQDTSLGSNPDVTGNVIENNSEGIWIGRRGSPKVSDQNRIRFNDIGVRVSYLSQPFQSGSFGNPRVITSSIHDNSSWNVLVESHIWNQGGILDFQNNWWGTTDPVAIEQSISDGADFSDRPTLDFDPILDAEDGNSLPLDNFIFGTLDSDRTIASGSTVEVIGTATVSAGTTLTIEAGATVLFDAGEQLEISGTLDVQGTAVSPAVFSSPAAARGSYVGLRLVSSSTATIDHALVEYAETGILVASSSNATITNTTVREFSDVGIHISSGGTVSVTDCSVDNTAGPREGTGINAGNAQVQNCDVRGANRGFQVSNGTLSGNVIEDNNTGIYIFGYVFPTINGGNRIRFNTDGVSTGCLSSPCQSSFFGQPVVNGNSIHDNTNYDVNIGSHNWNAAGILNFESNWWGTIDIALIEQNINDFADFGDRPTVDFSPFLDAEDGNPVTADDFLFGTLTADRTIATGTSVQVVGTATVPAGITLTVEAGATVEFDAGEQIDVNGTLDVQGASGNLAVFTSPAAARGTYLGIRLLSGANATIDYALVEYAETGILAASSSDATITNTTVREFSDTGISATSSGTVLITDCSVDNTAGAREGTGVSAGNHTVQGCDVRGANRGFTVANGTLSANVIEDNNTGIYISGYVFPTINGGNRIRFNDDGVSTGCLSSPCQSSFFGQPVVNDNSIHDNVNFDVNIGSHHWNGAGILDFQNNWWGSVDVAVIEQNINDHADDSDRPTVDYIPFLDAEDGTPIDPAGFLVGTLTMNETVATGTTVEVVGTVSVPTGVTLTVEAGATVLFDAGEQLEVEGTLDVLGASGNPATFSSPAAARGTWPGLRLVSGALATIDWAVVEYAETGILVASSSDATLSNVTVREFSDTGISLSTSGTALLSDCSVDNTAGARQGTGISAGNHTVQSCDVRGATRGFRVANGDLIGNIVEDNDTGIFIEGYVFPDIYGGNRIRFNDYGIQTGCLSSPCQSSFFGEPEVYGNSIHDNAIYDLSIGGHVWNAAGILDFRNNWWGSTDFAVISANIDDHGDFPERPWADYSPWLDAEDGNPILTHLIGPMDDTLPLAANTTYPVVGPILVEPGATWTLPEGVTVPMLPGEGLDVHGTLLVQGASGNPVTFQSSVATPDPETDYWTGIYVHPTSVGTLIDYAVLEHAPALVTVDTADATISNSELRYFELAGILVMSAPAGTISGNLFDNLESGVDRHGFAIDLIDASPTITGNTIVNSEVGIHVFGQSSPVVNGGNVITSNIWGFWIQGTGEPGEDPTPVINQNDIFGNDGDQPVPVPPAPPANPGEPGYAEYLAYLQSRAIVYCSTAGANLCSSDFSPGTQLIIDARENWWGSTDVATIRDGIAEDGVNPVLFDISNILDGPGGAIVPGTDPLYSVLAFGISRSSDVFRPTFGETLDLTFSVPVAANVTLWIYPESVDPVLPPVADPDLVRTYSFPGVPANVPQLVQWDGRDEAGNLVDDEAYIYVLEVDAGAFGLDYYNPPLIPNHQAAGCCGTSLPASFNTYRNEFWKIDYELFKHPLRPGEHNSRVSLRVTPEGGSTYTAIDGLPMTIGNRLLVWDGRDQNGDIVDGTTNLYFPVPRAMKPNHMIVENAKPSVRGPEFVSPPPPLGLSNVEVKSNPYLVYHSYDQVTRLAYEIDQDAYVTIKILRPGFSDPDNPTGVVATLVDNVLTDAADGGGTIVHEAEWLGYDPAGETNAMHSDEEGAFTFTIEAANALQTDLKTLYRGVIQVRR